MRILRTMSENDMHEVHQLIRNDNVEAICALFDKGIQLNYIGEYLTEFALKNGSLNALKFLCENGCTLWKKVLHFVLDDEIHDIYSSRVLDYGNWFLEKKLPCIFYAFNQGCQWVDEIWLPLIKYGGIEAVKKTRDIGVPWKPVVCSTAAKLGDLCVLNYVIDNGCRVYYQDLFYDCTHNIECLRYVHQKGGYMPEKFFPSRDGEVSAERWTCLIYMEKYGVKMLSIKDFNDKFTKAKNAYLTIEKYAKLKLSIKRTIARTSKIYDELIEKSWNPDRFMDWCLSEEKKKEIAERFALSA